MVSAPSISGWRRAFTHHGASFEVLAEGPEGTRLVWIADVLPHEVAGARVMQRALERCTVRG